MTLQQHTVRKHVVCAFLQIMQIRLADDIPHIYQSDPFVQMLFSKRIDNTSDYHGTEPPTRCNDLYGKPVGSIYKGKTSFPDEGVRIAILDIHRDAIKRSP